MQGSLHYFGAIRSHQYNAQHANPAAPGMQVSNSIIKERKIAAEDDSAEDLSGQIISIEDKGDLL